MSKKLIAFNVLILLLVTVVYIGEFYFLNYPMPFNAWYLIRESQIQYLPAVFAVTALASYLISSLDFKKLNFKSKFLSVFPFVNLLAIAFFVYIAADGYIKNKKELTKLENDYIREAEKDIKNDLIIHRYGGFVLPAYDEKTARLIDSIHRKYGTASKNTGCIVDRMDLKAQERYNELTDAYLEKRNGKGWQEKMEREIDEVKKTRNPGIK